MKVVKHVFSIAAIFLGAGCMFFCLVAGAPQDREALEDYVFCAAVFSLALSVFLIGCVRYILYLQKKVEKLEDRLKRISQTHSGTDGNLDKNHFVP